MTKNELKLLAAAAMLLDHVGIALLPQFTLLRIIGRLSFPIFAYSVYEGCKFTRNKKRYLGQMLALGLACVAGYYLYGGVLFGNVMITFSLSIGTLYCLRYLEDGIKNKDVTACAIGALAFTAALMGTQLLSRFLVLDYGFWGVQLPVWAELFDFASEPFVGSSPKMRKVFSLLGLFLGLMILAQKMGGNQIFGLLAMFPLAASNGKRGALNMKGFFYVFYPAHLIVIGAVALLLGK